MKVLIIGVGGIGAALGEALLGRDPSVELIVTSRTTFPASLLTFSDRATFYPLDPTEESQVKQLSETFDDVDWLINSTGMLCGDSIDQRMPEKSLIQIEEEFFLQNIRVNTLPTLWLAKHFALNLRGDRSRIFAALSARVGSIADNRLGGWHSYRISKSALNMAPMSGVYLCPTSASQRYIRALLTPICLSLSKKTLNLRSYFLKSWLLTSCLMCFRL